MECPTFVQLLHMSYLTPKWPNVGWVLFKESCLKKSRSGPGWVLCSSARALEEASRGPGPRPQAPYPEWVGAMIRPHLAHPKLDGPAKPRPEVAVGVWVVQGCLGPACRFLGPDRGCPGWQICVSVNMGLNIGPDPAVTTLYSSHYCTWPTLPFGQQSTISNSVLDQEKHRGNAYHVWFSVGIFCRIFVDNLTELWLKLQKWWWNITWMEIKSNPDESCATTINPGQNRGHRHKPNFLTWLCQRHNELYLPIIETDYI